MTMAPTLQALPTGLFNLADHEAHARDTLSPAVWSYFSGGAGDELTLRANRDAWDTLRLFPRVLRPLQGLHTGIHLLGKPWPTPLLVAPMAHQRLAHPDGELASATAAAALGAGMVLSTQSNTPLEAVAKAALADHERGPLWFQLYTLGDRGWLRELMQRAYAAGFEAFVLTVDAPINGVRDREQRSGFALPPGLTSVHGPDRGATRNWEQLMAQAPTWDDVRWLIEHAPLPVLLKGISHPSDARLGCELGAQGLIVSNHGGRVLDTLPATSELLPRVADAVGGDCPVLVDGGIRRGTDVLKAHALGASAVLVGRPVAYGLANAGAAGVAHVLRLLLDELRAAMALCGLRQLSEIRPEMLWRHENCY
jgi:4-hydroxymandelate oxidase